MGDRRFADLADAGRHLGRLLASEGVDAGAIALAVMPNGMPVGRQVARLAGLELAGLAVRRDADGVHVGPLPQVAGRTVVVVDDGVESGALARAADDTVRRAGARHVVLAVPVCPQALAPDLARRYDRLVAVVISGEGRSLASHYDVFDTVDTVDTLDTLDTVDT